ncbi:MAG: phosphatase PAP2-related protein [Janthinobacterium lividum]
MPVLPSTLSPATAAAAPVATVGFAAWRQGWARPAFRWSWGVLVVLLFGVVIPLVPGFFHYIQLRPASVVADPVLGLLPRLDVAWPIFALMYGGVLAAAGWLTARPYLFLRGLWGYLLLLLMRMAAIWLVPMAPPLDIVAMPDPFLALVFHTDASQAITKDLFFSGHTSTVALLALAVRGRWWRRTLALAALCIAVLVLVQRVHYSYDVVAAPFFAWLAYWAAGYIVRPAVPAE